MPIRFLRKEGSIPSLTSLSRDNPLPVCVYNTEPLPTEPSHTDTLLVVETAVTTTPKDLFGTTTTELPTLDQCGQYRKLIWIAHRSSITAINYTLRARATNISGTPLGTGWRLIASGSFGTTGDDNSNWVRLDIPTTGEGFWDQYRIEVNIASGSLTLTSKIIGVR